jgi:hypothetical protein
MGDVGLTLHYKQPQDQLRYRSRPDYDTLLSALHFSVILGVFNSTFKDSDDENKALTTFNSFVSDTKNVIDAYILYISHDSFKNQDSVFTLMLKFKVHQENAWKNQLLGIIDLRNKLLRANIYFTNYRNIQIAPMYVAFFYPKGMPSIFDFTKASFHHNTGNHAFFGATYSHLMKDEEINFKSLPK